MKKCPNCNKKELLINYTKGGRLECPKYRLGKGGVPEPYGCGYVLMKEEQRKLK